MRMLKGALHVATRNTYPLTSSREWIAFAWRWALMVVACVGVCMMGYSIIIQGSPVAKFFGAVFGVGLGVLALLLSFTVMKRCVWLKRHGQEVEGYVTEVGFTLVGTLWPLWVCYRYGYEFCVDGKDYEGWHPYCRYFWRPKIHVGDDVAVLIDPRNPKVRQLLGIKRRNI